MRARCRRNAAELVPRQSGVPSMRPRWLAGSQQALTLSRSHALTLSRSHALTLVVRVFEDTQARIGFVESLPPP